MNGGPINAIRILIRYIRYIGYIPYILYRADGYVSGRSASSSDHGSSGHPFVRGVARAGERLPIVHPAAAKSARFAKSLSANVRPARRVRPPEES